MSRRTRQSLDRLITQFATFVAHCPLPVKCLLARAQQPLDGLIAQKAGTMKTHKRFHDSGKSAYFFISFSQ